jgi:hypothetical protein
VKLNNLARTCLARRSCPLVAFLHHRRPFHRQHPPVTARAISMSQTASVTPCTRLSGECGIKSRTSCFVNARIRIWIGALLAFGGVSALFGSIEVRSSPLFVLAGIASAVMCAFAIVYAKKNSNQSPLLTLPPAMLLSGAGTLLTGAVLENDLTISSILATASIGALLYLAILGSGVAFFLNVWLLQQMEARKVALSALIIPFIAVCAGIVFGRALECRPGHFGYVDCPF